jgi:hypothetical protein
LVRYYKGERDPKRTPFATQKEAMQFQERSKSQKRPSGWWSGRLSSSGLVEVGGGKEQVVVWEYQDTDVSWKPIGVAAQDAIEAAYQSYVLTKQPTYSEYKSVEWTYRLDFQTMTQTNTEHFSRNQRDVRRRELDYTGLK